MMTEAPPEWVFRQHVLETLRGYRTAQTLITCSELGVFEALAAGPRTVAELAAGLKTTTRGLSLLLNAAVGIGLLEKADERYTNTPLAAACLAQDGPYYLSHFVKREGAFYRRWSHLTAAVKTGQRPKENTRDEEPDDWVRGFELALYSSEQWSVN